MPVYDLSTDELRAYRPDRDEPADFDAFWGESLAKTRAYPLDARFERCPGDAGLVTVTPFDVTFTGWAGTPVRGWLLLPREREGRLPCVVQYLGYGGGRGLPHDQLLYSAAGYAHLVMDTRGQGSAWQRGDTPDADSDSQTGHYPGFMTRGVLDPRTYYYRRLMCDAVRAVEAARTHPDVDPDRIAVTGASQGGGLSLAVAALVPDLAAVLPDVPFLCHFRRAVQIAADPPYTEITNYCSIRRDQAERALATLSYFDGVNFAARATAPAWFSAGLMDTVTPPSTIFAAYNHYAGRKDMQIWPFNGHEGGESHQQARHLEVLREVFEKS